MERIENEKMHAQTNAHARKREKKTVLGFHSFGYKYKSAKQKLL